MTGWRAARGQAAVEVVALVPLALIVGLAAREVLVAGAAREAAHDAAHAGAVALSQGGDAERAVGRALADWPTSQVDIRVRGGRVSVQVRPKGLWPAVDRALEAEAEAVAGPGSSR